MPDSEVVNAKLIAIAEDVSELKTEFRHLSEKLERWIESHDALHRALADNNASVREKLWIELTSVKTQLNWRSGLACLALIGGILKEVFEAGGPRPPGH